MNYPVWYLPDIGGGLLIALIAILHVFVSHFAVGGDLYLIYAEKKDLREHSDGILAFTKRHARSFLLLIVDIVDLLGRLDDVLAEMEPFSGSDAEAAERAAFLGTP